MMQGVIGEGDSGTYPHPNHSSEGVLGVFLLYSVQSHISNYDIKIIFIQIFSSLHGISITSSGGSKPIKNIVLMALNQVGPKNGS